MPEDPAEKIVFIAGGIGITPYRSMIKYLLDTHEKRDVILFYSERKPENFVYRDVFDEAEQRIGIKPVYTVTEAQNMSAGGWSGKSGMISSDMIKSEVPDYFERTYYISGPHPMVSSMQDMLHGLGVPRSKIKTDFFPGYA
jgi:ferredoxin-NADP reductase